MRSGLRWHEAFRSCRIPLLGGAPKLALEKIQSAPGWSPVAAASHSFAPRSPAKDFPSSLLTPPDCTSAYSSHAAPSDVHERQRRKYSPAESAGVGRDGRAWSWPVRQRFGRRGNACELSLLTRPADMKRAPILSAQCFRGSHGATLFTCWRAAIRHGPGCCCGFSSRRRRRI